jgi:hypothetical protein
MAYLFITSVYVSSVQTAEETRNRLFFHLFSTDTPSIEKRDVTVAMLALQEAMHALDCIQTVNVMQNNSLTDGLQR